MGWQAEAIAIVVSLIVIIAMMALVYLFFGPHF